METTDKIVTTKELFSDEKIRAKFQEMLGKKAQGFIVSVLQVVASNEMLKRADPNSVYNSAAVAATLDLPINNSLGFAYIVPYNESYKDDFGNWATRNVAQFQIGYKGFKQLALRSGQFLLINATDVREGEIKKHDRLSGEMEFEWMQDETAREKTKIVGYVSYFKLLNGFTQVFYMTVEKLTEHGKRYSQTFKKDKGRWKDDFDGMCRKTVIKLNLSKNAPLSVDMQRAMVVDQAIINDPDTLDVTHVDNDQKKLDQEITKEELQDLFDSLAPELGKKDFENGKRILDNNEKESYKKLYTELQKLVKDGSNS
jgi:recombination protein RecT